MFALQFDNTLVVVSPVIYEHAWMGEVSLFVQDGDTVKVGRVFITRSEWKRAKGRKFERLLKLVGGRYPGRVEWVDTLTFRNSRKAGEWLNRTAARRSDFVRAKVDLI